MHLFFRLLWYLATALRRPACPPLGPCRTPFRVLPTDLDVLRHVNNGVYLSLLDFARVDLMIRAGFFWKLQARGWYPVVSGQMIQFRRSLQLFEAFEVETHVLGWDGQAFFLHHRFLRDGQSVATAVVRLRFLRRAGGTLRPEEVLAVAGGPAESPALPDWVLRWNQTLVALREA